MTWQLHGIAFGFVASVEMINFPLLWDYNGWNAWRVLPGVFMLRASTSVITSIASRSATRSWIGKTEAFWSGCNCGLVGFYMCVSGFRGEIRVGDPVVVEPWPSSARESSTRVDPVTSPRPSRRPQ